MTIFNNWGIYVFLLAMIYINSKGYRSFRGKRGDAFFKKYQLTSYLSIFLLDVWMGYLVVIVGMGLRNPSEVELIMCVIVLGIIGILNGYGQQKLIKAHIGGIPAISKEKIKKTKWVSGFMFVCGIYGVFFGIFLIWYSLSK